MASTYSADEKRQMAESVGQWWHSIDLGDGVVTPGVKTPEILAREVETLRLPALMGKTVLDIGAYDGFYSFEAEKRGAARVVALDHYVWSLDLTGHFAYWRQCKETGVSPPANEVSQFWHPDTLPGRKGFDTAHQLLDSTVEPVVGNFMEMDLTSLGQFDVVFFLGVLYHMENPLLSLRKLASVTREVAIIETHAVLVPNYEHLEICEFFSGSQLNGDPSNWWAPNTTALVGMCQAAGFSRVQLVHELTRATSELTLVQRTRRKLGKLRRVLMGRDGTVHYLRAIVHAWK